MKLSHFIAILALNSVALMPAANAAVECAKGSSLSPLSGDHVCAYASQISRYTDQVPQITGLALFGYNSSATSDSTSDIVTKDVCNAKLLQSSNDYVRTQGYVCGYLASTPQTTN